MSLLLIPESNLDTNKDYCAVIAKIHIEENSPVVKKNSTTGPNSIDISI